MCLKKYNYDTEMVKKKQTNLKWTFCLFFIFPSIKSAALVLTTCLPLHTDIHRHNGSRGQMGVPVRPL